MYISHVYLYNDGGASWSSGLTRYHYVAAMQEVNGSNPGHSIFFCRSDGFDILLVTRCEAKMKADLGGEVKKRRCGTPCRRGKAGAATRDGKTGRQTWNGYEKGIHFDLVRFEDD